MADPSDPESLKLIRWDPPSGDAEKAGALAKMVGALVIYYALVEHWIDGIVLCVHSRVPGANELRKRHPFNAKAEREFLQESFSTLPDLVRFKDEALDLLSKLDPLAEFRHDVVHGHIRHFNVEEEWMEFSRVIEGDGREPVRRTLTVTAESLYNRGAEIGALITPFREFTQRLLIAFDPTYPREESRGSLGWTLASVLPVVKKVGD